MAEVTEAALANCTKQVIIWGCFCHSVVMASDYVQAAAVETVHTAHRWLSERPCFRCVCQRRTHSKLVRHQLQLVCPCAGERAECSLCDGHAMTNVSVVSAITLHSRPPDTRTSRRSRAECCRRTPGSAARRFAICTALSTSEPRRERCVTPSSHQRAAWIFNQQRKNFIRAFCFRAKIAVSCRTTCMLASELQPRPPSLSWCEPFA